MESSGNLLVPQVRLKMALPGIARGTADIARMDIGSYTGMVQNSKVPTQVQAFNPCCTNMRAGLLALRHVEAKRRADSLLGSLFKAAMGRRGGVHRRVIP